MREIAMRMPFGKYRGCDLGVIPHDYLLWVLDKCDRAAPTLREQIRQKLGIRPRRPEPSTSIAPSIIGSWYRRLAMEFHPDHRGSDEGMKAVNRAHELLREMVGAV